VHQYYDNNDDEDDYKKNTNFSFWFNSLQADTIDYDNQIKLNEPVFSF